MSARVHFTHMYALPDITSSMSVSASASVLEYMQPFRPLIVNLGVRVEINLKGHDMINGIGKKLDSCTSISLKYYSNQTV